MKILRLGLGWDTNMDLDASIIMMDKFGEVVDQVWFNGKQSKCGSIKHSGDNRTGDAKGDDENIDIDLNKIAANVYSFWPVVTIYTRGN